MNAPLPPTKTKKSKKVEASQEQTNETAGEQAADAAPKEKKPRAPRKDYGFAPTSTIKLTDGEKSYRGQRLEWYEVLKAHEGKTVADFLEASKDRKDPGRGWLRFFVQDEACTLTPAPASEEQQAA